MREGKEEGGRERKRRGREGKEEGREREGRWGGGKVRIKRRWYEVRIEEQG